MAAKGFTFDDLYKTVGRRPKSVSQDNFVLTKVIGLTNLSKNALDCNPVTGHVAFPASSLVVILDPQTSEQKYIERSPRRLISCVSFSDDGRLVAYGQFGLKPVVFIWALKENKEHSKFVADHCVGVRSVAFHPKLSYLVIIGVHDLNVGVWDYTKCQRLALMKWQTVPMSMTIPRSGSSVILCGHRKITALNLEKIDSNSYETNVFEDRKAVLLGRQSEYTFVDITSGRGMFEKSVYAITSCGYLCQIKLGDILIDKAIKVDSHAFCIRYALHQVFVGCCEGCVKICNPETLNIAATVSLEQLLGSNAFPEATSKLHLDTMAIAIDENESLVTCIYANCSLHSWYLRVSNGDEIQCCLLIPPTYDVVSETELNSISCASVCTANMFRAFFGCIEQPRVPRLVDTEDLVTRQGMRGPHNVRDSATYTCFRFSPDGQDIICGNERGEIKIFSAPAGFLKRVIEAHNSQVTCIELLYDDENKLVCSGGRDRIIFILNAKSNYSLVQVLCDHSSAITAISLKSNGGIFTLVSAASDNVILIRRSIPGCRLKFTVIGELMGYRGSKTINIVNDYIIAGDKEGNIKLFKADPIFNEKSSKTVKSVPSSGQKKCIQHAMNMDPTGSFIAAALSSGFIHVYSVHTGQAVASLPCQTGVSAITFTNSLKYIISATCNGCTMVWRLPQRMTEFLETKRNKSFQIEVAKEFSFQATFMKMHHKTAVSNSLHQLTCSSSDTSHRYDTRLNASVESLDYLCHRRHRERRGAVCHSLVDSYSSMSCSTCTQSSMDTIHACQSSESSAESSTDLLWRKSNLNIGKTIVHEAKCIRIGAFKDKFFERDGKTEAAPTDSTGHPVVSGSALKLPVHLEPDSPTPNPEKLKIVENGEVKTQPAGRISETKVSNNISVTDQFCVTTKKQVLFEENFTTEIMKVSSTTEEEKQKEDYKPMEFQTQEECVAKPETLVQKENATQMGNVERIENEAEKENAKQDLLVRTMTLLRLLQVRNNPLLHFLADAQSSFIKSTTLNKEVTSNICNADTFLQPCNLQDLEKTSYQNSVMYCKSAKEASPAQTEASPLADTPPPPTRTKLIPFRDAPAPPTGTQLTPLKDAPSCPTGTQLASFRDVPSSPTGTRVPHFKDVLQSSQKASVKAAQLWPKGAGGDDSGKQPSSFNSHE